MAWPLVVEGEPAFAVADRDQAAVEGEVAQCCRSTAVGAGLRAIGRPQRAAREGVQEIGEQQLLMLLLVVEPELDDRACPGIAAFEQAHHRRIDAFAPSHYFGQRRP